MREQKKVHKNVQQQQQVGRAQVVAALKRALALINAEKGERPLGDPVVVCSQLNSPVSRPPFSPVLSSDRCRGT